MVWKKDMNRHNIASHGAKTRKSFSAPSKIDPDKDADTLYKEILLEQNNPSVVKEAYNNLMAKFIRMGGSIPDIEILYLAHLTDDKYIKAGILTNIMLLLKDDVLKQRIRYRVTGHEFITVETIVLRLLIDELDIPEETKRALLKELGYNVGDFDIIEVVKGIPEVMKRIQRTASGTIGYDVMNGINLTFLLTTNKLRYNDKVYHGYNIMDLFRLYNLTDYEFWSLTEREKKDIMKEIIMKTDILHTIFRNSVNTQDKLIGIIGHLDKVDLKEYVSSWENIFGNRTIKTYLEKLGYMLLKVENQSAFQKNPSDMIQFGYNFGRNDKRGIPTIIDLMFAMNRGLAKKDRKLMEVIAITGLYENDRLPSRLEDTQNPKPLISLYQLLYDDIPHIDDSRMDVEERRRLIKSKEVTSMYKAIVKGDVDKALKYLKKLMDTYHLKPEMLENDDELREYLKRTITYRLHNSKMDVEYYIKTKDAVGIFAHIPDRYDLYEKILIMNNIVGRYYAEEYYKTQIGMTVKGLLYNAFTDENDDNTENKTKKPVIRKARLIKYFTSKDIFDTEGMADLITRYFGVVMNKYPSLDVKAIIRETVDSTLFDVTKRLVRNRRIDDNNMKLLKMILLERILYNMNSVVVQQGK